MDNIKFFAKKENPESQSSKVENSIESGEKNKSLLNFLKMNLVKILESKESKQEKIKNKEREEAEKEEREELEKIKLEILNRLDTYTDDQDASNHLKEILTHSKLLKPRTVEAIKSLLSEYYYSLNIDNTLPKNALQDRTLDLISDGEIENFTREIIYSLINDKESNLVIEKNSEKMKLSLPKELIEEYSNKIDIAANERCLEICEKEIKLRKPEDFVEMEKVIKETIHKILDVFGEETVQNGHTSTGLSYSDKHIGIEEGKQYLKLEVNSSQYYSTYPGDYCNRCSAGSNCVHHIDLLVEKLKNIILQDKAKDFKNESFISALDNLGENDQNLKDKLGGFISAKKNTKKIEYSNTATRYYLKFESTAFYKEVLDYYSEKSKNATQTELKQYLEISEDAFLKYNNIDNNENSKMKIEDLISVNPIYKEEDNDIELGANFEKIKNQSQRLDKSIFDINELKKQISSSNDTKFRHEKAIEVIDIARSTYTDELEEIVNLFKKKDDYYKNGRRSVYKNLFGEDFMSKYNQLKNDSKPDSFQKILDSEELDQLQELQLSPEFKNWLTKYTEQSAYIKKFIEEIYSNKSTARDFRTEDMENFRKIYIPYISTRSGGDDLKSYFGLSYNTLKNITEFASEENEKIRYNNNYYGRIVDLIKKYYTKFDGAPLERPTQ